METLKKFMKLEEEFREEVGYRLSTAKYIDTDMWLIKYFTDNGLEEYIVDMITGKTTFTRGVEKTKNIIERKCRDYILMGGLS